MNIVRLFVVVGTQLLIKVKFYDEIVDTAMVLISLIPPEITSCADLFTRSKFKRSRVYSTKLQTSAIDQVLPWRRALPTHPYLRAVDNTRRAILRPRSNTTTVAKLPTLVCCLFVCSVLTTKI